jgi:hypothetical protein
MVEFEPSESDDFRYGGPQVQHDEDDEEEDDEETARQAERERKKAEVRKRLEEAGRMKKAKKGFLTPERKKKLRKLLMLKAADDLKKQQQVREQQRAKTLQERILPLPDDLDNMDDEDVREVAEEFAARVLELESNVYDLSYLVRQKDFEVNELTIAVNDLRGKFVKPTLKKVSKTQGKFDKLNEKKVKTQKVDLRQNLKNVEKNKFALDDEVPEKSKAEWAKN